MGAVYSPTMPSPDCTLACYNDSTIAATTRTIGSSRQHRCDKSHMNCIYKKTEEYFIFSVTASYLLEVMVVLQL